MLTAPGPCSATSTEPAASYISCLVYGGTSWKTTPAQSNGAVCLSSLPLQPGPPEFGSGCPWVFFLFFFKLLLQDDCMAKKVYSIHCIIVSALRLLQAFRQSSRLGAEQHMWCNPLFSEGHFHLHLCLQLCTCGFSSRTELCCSAFGSGKCRSDYIFSCAINF